MPATLPVTLGKEREKDIAASEDLLKQAVQHANKHLGKTTPALHQTALDAIVAAPAVEGAWQAQTRDTVAQDWQDDPLRPHLLNISNDSYMHGLVKYTTRFYKAMPEDIVGEERNLAYDVDQNERTITINGQARKHPAWPKHFSGHFREVLSHGIWQGLAGAVAICFQYVVKCRRNDQRQMTWPLENPTSDKFFDVFAAVSQANQTGELSVVELHDQVLQRMNGIPSPWSRLFREIENVAFNGKVEPERGDPLLAGQVGMYHLRTEDISLLIKALDNIKDAHGMPVYRKVAFSNRASTAAIASNDLPTKNNLSQLRDASFQSRRQRLSKAAVLGRPAASAIPSTPKFDSGIDIGGNNPNPFESPSPRADESARKSADPMNASELSEVEMDDQRDVSDDLSYISDNDDDDELMRMVGLDPDQVRERLAWLMDEAASPIDDDASLVEDDLRLPKASRLPETSEVTEPAERQSAKRVRSDREDSAFDDGSETNRGRVVKPRHSSPGVESQQGKLDMTGRHLRSVSISPGSEMVARSLSRPSGSQAEAQEQQPPVRGVPNQYWLGRKFVR